MTHLTVPACLAIVSVDSSIPLTADEADQTGELSLISSDLPWITTKLADPAVEKPPLFHLVQALGLIEVVTGDGYRSKQHHLFVRFRTIAKKRH